MEQVPDELDQRALQIAKTIAVPGKLPEFDEKVFGKDHTYRIVAIAGQPSHIMVFYRKPKYWIFP